MGKKEKKKISVKQTMTHEETVSFLKTLMDSFNSREVIVKNEEDSLLLVPADEIGMELKAKVKKGKVKMKIALSWSELPQVEALVAPAEPETEAAVEEVAEQPDAKEEPQS
ncbi:amphi-Trp domain-containing protein [Maridesulfovibrio sp.]|uniref:amphi-Trp domain-containing protein n=1 Tax=Maridesulfovibrio sp. TaxID=2795000 RepID=UPI002A18B081|nr:amphi-Trp domain-containing protein [Maridesulfovibrio sp.]